MAKRAEHNPRRKGTMFERIGGEPVPIGFDDLESTPPQSKENEYRPFESKGISETEYWKKRYLEARREAVSEPQTGVGERCEVCNLRSPFAWVSPDDLWEQVTGRKDGKLCPYCFNRTALEKGVRLYWRVNTEFTEAQPESREREALEKIAMHEHTKSEYAPSVLAHVVSIAKVAILQPESERG
jgi:hypothetical protein